ncbi:MAG: hypothetical protein KJ042_08135 [Deltaproteobacteria bacterium]|nr:hypothetical protein [Deltaproteobacteria bacterium]
MTDRSRKAAFAVALVAAFVVYWGNFEGAPRDYWDTYIVLPATFLTGEPGMIVDEHGNAAYRQELRGELPRDLLAPDDFGVISKDQRIGAGVTFAPAYLAFGMAGFRALYALFGAMTVAFAHSLGRRLFVRDGAGRIGEWQAALLAILVGFNPYMLLMNRLNANFVAVPIALALVVLLVDERPRPLVAGLVYGALGGIKNEAIVLAPAIIVLIAARPGRVRSLALFGAGAFVTIAPYLAWNRFAFGRALIHASQFSEFDGWRPTFPHEILGFHFELNGLFNWPFHETLVRTPHYPFPTYLTLPLTLHIGFGGLGLALALMGAFARRTDGAPGLAAPVRASMALWIVCWLGLFLFQENWEEPKNTFGVLAIVPLGVFAAAGLGVIVAGRRDARRWIALVGCVAAIEIIVASARFVQAPVDERWYLRFPKAKTEAQTIGCLDDRSRREWMFFHTDECASELDEQRRKLTRPALLPRPYYPLVWNESDLGETLGARRPRVFDIWDKIYGE